MDLFSTTNESVFPMTPITHTMASMIKKTSSHNVVDDILSNICHFAVMSCVHTRVSRIIATVIIVALCLVVICIFLVFANYCYCILIGNGTVLVPKCSSISQLFLPIIVVTVLSLCLHSTPTVAIGNTHHPPPGAVLLSSK